MMKGCHTPSGIPPSCPLARPPVQGGACGDTLFGWPELEYATRVTRGSVVTISDSTAVTWNF